MYALTTTSHYMQSRFPDWQPMVIGTHDTLAEAEDHLKRVRMSHNGVLPTNRDYEIVRVK